KRAKIWRIRARKSGEAKLQDIIFIYSSPPEKYELLKTRPVPNGTLGGVRGSDDTYSIEPAVTGDSFAFCESI
uniref:hypothetical protein n=1 Tax=Faecalibaculum rodentium TaxID=1702221 RepID=UPI001C3D2D4F